MQYSTEWITKCCSWFDCQILPPGTFLWGNLHDDVCQADFYTTHWLDRPLILDYLLKTKITFFANSMQFFGGLCYGTIVVMENEPSHHKSRNLSVCLCALKYLKSRLRDLLHSSSVLLGTQGLKFCAVWTHMFSTNRYWITKPKLFCMAVEAELQGSNTIVIEIHTVLGKRYSTVPTKFLLFILNCHTNHQTNSNITHVNTKYRF